MMENDKKLRLQEVYGEFRFMASKFFSRAKCFT